MHTTSSRPPEPTAPLPEPVVAPTPEQRLGSRTVIRIAKYVAVGGLQFVLDVGLFYALHLFSMPVVPANILSRLTAATIGYVANRHFTFGVPRQKSYRMVAKYWLFWVSMTAISSGLLWAWESFTTTVWQVTLGKLLIDGGLCVAGFFISQKYIYKHDS